jgi:hypothetical protein
VVESKGGVLNGHRNTVVAAIVSAVLGATGGPILLVKLGVNPYRQDAYTSTMADEHRENDERRFQALENHVANHPDITNKFERRISTLEAQSVIIISQLAYIRSRVDEH